MVRWYAGLSRGAILSRELIALAGQEIRTSDGRPTGYGLGWYVSRVGEEVVMHHGGSSVGFVAYNFWNPVRGSYAGVFGNYSDRRGEPKAQARALFDAMSAA